MMDDGAMPLMPHLDKRQRHHVGQAKPLP